MLKYCRRWNSRLISDALWSRAGNNYTGRLKLAYLCASNWVAHAMVSWCWVDERSRQSLHIANAPFYCYIIEFFISNRHAWGPYWSSRLHNEGCQLEVYFHPCFHSESIQQIIGTWGVLVKRPFGEMSYPRFLPTFSVPYATLRLRRYLSSDINPYKVLMPLISRKPTPPPSFLIGVKGRW
jgi:hypothetical protein